MRLIISSLFPLFSRSGFGCSFVDFDVDMMTSRAKSATDRDMLQQRGLKIYFDGGCRPNPGQMETAVVARGVTHHRTDCGYGTSNDAEWLALVHAIEIALSAGVGDVVLLGDSASVVGQANGVTRCRAGGSYDQLQTFLALKSGLDRVRIRHIGRHQNLAGIALAKTRWG